MEKDKEFIAFQQQHQPLHSYNPNSKKCLQCQSQQNYLLNLKQNDWICRNCYNIIDQQQSQLRKKKRILYCEIDQILPNLFLGNEDTAMDRATLQKNGIGAILVCGCYLPALFKDFYHYKVLYVSDSIKFNIFNLFDQAYDWIKKMHLSNKKVFVHCQHGVSRSPSFVIAYLMRQYKWSASKAKLYVKQKRQCISPNSGFSLQLMNYQIKLKEQPNSTQHIKTIKNNN